MKADDFILYVYASVMLQILIAMFIGLLLLGTSSHRNFKEIELAKMREPSFPANSNPYYPRSYASKNTMELVDAILFQEEKQPKENHPHGWYRKFEKKRF